MNAVESITTAIEDALRLFHEPGDAFEVRIPKAGKAGTVSGYYTDHAKAAADIVKRDGKVPGIYVTLNPVDPALMARSANRLKERATDTTSDRDVVRRRRLLIDVDFGRPAGISATDGELNAAGRKAQQIKAYLEDECGWPEGILVHSGNGAHLLYLIDLPNDDESRDLVKRVLVALAKKFDEGGVHVDTSVFNAARIVKVPGTMTCKGDNLPERPHRRSTLLTQPETPTPVPVSLLVALTGTVKPKGGLNAGGNGHGTFDVEEFMACNDLVVRKHKQDHAGDLWELEVCPVNPEHDQGEAFVSRDASGALLAGCQHQSCTWRWPDLREMFEPGYRERRNGDGSKPAKQKPKQEPAADVVVAPGEAPESEPAPACETARAEAPKPLPLGDAAFHGPLGDFVRAWEPHTEADPAALLATALVGFSSIVGSGPRHTVSDDVHAARLWACVVGASSAARKGMSYKPARNLLAGVDPGWESRCNASGLSTGEGLIHRVRDQVLGTQTDKKTGETTEFVEDPGVEDKRLFLLESEFARVLTVMARRDNTLSAIARGLWDSGEAGVMTRSAPATTHGAHVCIIAHITMEELRRALTDCDAANGFANRFLWVYAERHGRLPFGGAAEPAKMEQIRGQLARAFIHAPDGEIGWSEDARQLWDEAYDGLLRCGGGLTGSIIARGQPQALRLALVYALADDVVEIGRVHLEAALEVWRYCAESARYLFGERTGDNAADRILAELRERGALTRSAIRELFQRNKSSAEIGAALTVLEQAGSAQRTTDDHEGGAGRPAEVWTAC